jgi:hypothetical protein
MWKSKKVGEKPSAPKSTYAKEPFRWKGPLSSLG